MLRINPGVRGLTLTPEYRLPLSDPLQAVPASAWPRYPGKTGGIAYPPQKSRSILRAAELTEGKAILLRANLSFTRGASQTVPKGYDTTPSLIGLMTIVLS